MYRIECSLSTKVAGVARLNLTEEELKSFENSFEEILKHFSSLHKAKIKDGKERESEINPLRDDKISESRTAKKIMKNVPYSENNLLKVPRGSK